MTYQEAVQQYVTRAAAIVCAGTCSSFGGIPASGPDPTQTNPTQVVSVKTATGLNTINVSGCPANPDWVIWTIVQLLLGRTISLDANGRPIDLYAKDLNGNPCVSWIYEKCPRKDNGLPEASRFGQANRCVKKLGCRGPTTKANCEARWNGIAGQGHWCIGVNAPCHGCTEPGFPGTASFYVEDHD